MSNAFSNYLATSVDDLRSTLHCELVNIADHNVAERITFHEQVLAVCPEKDKTKRKVIETHLRALRKLSPPKAGVREITLGDLAVLPPVKRAAAGKPMPLAEIEDHIRALDAEIADKTRGFHNEVIYKIVAKGLMLLKGREVHLRQGQKALVETVSTSAKKPTSRALAKIEEKGEQGFLAWLGEKFEDQSTRTARNYMNAARNAGLTSDHGLEDVEALRLAMALHEKNPTDLYRLADAVKPAPEKESSTPAVSLIATTQRDLFASLDQVIALREETGPEDYEAVTQRLHATLEKYTGARWIMSESDDSAEHASMHAARGQAKPVKKAKAGSRIASAAKARWVKQKANRK